MFRAFFLHALMESLALFKLPEDQLILLLPVAVVGKQRFALGLPFHLRVLPSEAIPNAAEALRDSGCADGDLRVPTLFRRLSTLLPFPALPLDGLLVREAKRSLCFRSA